MKPFPMSAQDKRYIIGALVRSVNDPKIQGRVVWASFENIAIYVEGSNKEPVVIPISSHLEIDTKDANTQWVLLQYVRELCFKVEISYCKNFRPKITFLRHGHVNAPVSFHEEIGDACLLYLSTVRT